MIPLLVLECQNEVQSCHAEGCNSETERSSEETGLRYALAMFDGGYDKSLAEYSQNISSLLLMGRTRMDQLSKG